MSTNQRNGAVGYKKLLLECKELAKRGRKAAFTLATNLVAVFNDQDFRADIGASDDFAVADALNEYVGDLCLSFLEIKTLLSEFPNEADWSGAKSLAKLYEDAIQKINDRKPERAERAVTPRQRVTREVHEKVVTELQDRNARLQYVEKQTEQQASTIDQLRAENQDLKIENAQLKGRIAELERIVKRELQSA